MGSPEATAAPRPLVRRGVVIVHGVGEQGKGDYIASFVEPLASFVADACGSENVAITVRNEEGSSSWATLHIKGDTRDEEWHVREAWWARNFKPSSSKTVLFWGILAGLTILWATWRSIFVRAVARLRHDYQQMTLSLDDLYGRPLDPDTRRLKRDTDQGLWVVPQTFRAKAILDGFVWLFICALYLVFALVLITILVPLYIVLLLPLGLILPKPVAAFQRKLVGLLVSSIGDQQAMTTRRFALAGASNEVAQALWYMLVAGRTQAVETQRLDVRGIRDGDRHRPLRWRRRLVRCARRRGETVDGEGTSPGGSDSPEAGHLDYRRERAEPRVSHAPYTGRP